MAELDPRLILAAGDINDPSKMLSLQELAMKLKGQQQQMQSQNMLKQLFANPKSYNPQTGAINPEALRGVLAVDPQTGMDLMQHQAQLTDAKLKRTGMIQDMVAPVRDSALEAYDAAIKGGASQEAAMAAGQKALDEGTAPLKSGGALSDDEQQQLATKFDPVQFRARALSYKDQQALNEKEKSDERADKRLADQEAHEDRLANQAAATAARANQKGWDVRVDKDGTEYRYNPDTAQATTLNGEPYKIQGGASKVGSDKGDAGKFTPEMGALGAALAEKGVSLPAGLRSKEQQARMYQGLLDRHPGKSVDEIADMVKTGQIELAAQKKETQTAAGSAGKVEVAQNELKEFIPLVREASAAVPRGNFVPLNKLSQMADSSISDPNLRALKVRINSVLNAYDQLAARGGTDAAKREETRNLLLSADSPEVLDAALKSFELEADAARRAAVKATKVPELEESDKGSKDGAPVDHSKMSDDELKKLLGIH